jgi:hypothetical protein
MVAPVAPLVVLAVHVASLLHLPDLMLPGPVDGLYFRHGRADGVPGALPLPVVDPAAALRGVGAQVQGRQRGAETDDGGGNAHWGEQR